MQPVGPGDWDAAVQKRGGYLQQGEALFFDENQRKAPSQLADALAFLIGWGLLYPTQAAWLARCGVADGIEHKNCSIAII